MRVCCQIEVGGLPDFTIATTWMVTIIMVTIITPLILSWANRSISSSSCTQRLFQGLVSMVIIRLAAPQNSWWSRIISNQKSLPWPRPSCPVPALMTMSGRISCKSKPFLYNIMKNLCCRMDKVAVVLLVAAGTVCFLTNLLVLAILVKQKAGRLTFRYQIVLSQCLAGLFSATVVMYPLKVIQSSSSSYLHNQSVCHRGFHG